MGIILAAAVLCPSCNLSKLGNSTDDKAITTQIQAELFDDSVLKMRDIHVASDKGTVTLTGTVDTDLEKAAEERLASRAESVRSVVNRLTVSRAAAVEPPAKAQSPATSEAPLARSTAATAAKSQRPRPSHPARRALSANSQETPAEEASNPPASAENSPQMSAQNAAAPAAVAPAPLPAPAAPTAPPTVKPPEQITVPAGTFFSVRMIDSIDSSRNATGDEFAATLDVPLLLNGRVVVPRHADAKVRLVQASSAGRMSGRSELKVELVSVTAGGQAYPLETDYYDQAGASRSTRTAETVGGGAVVGGLLGAIVGRGRGAAIGSVAGAGTGAAVEARTHGQQVKIPSETKLSFTLKSPVTFTVNSNPGAAPPGAGPSSGPQPAAASPAPTATHPEATPPPPANNPPPSAG